MVCPLHGGPVGARSTETAIEFLHLQNPKNYKFLPPEFTSNIKAAGKITRKSEKVGNLLKRDDH